MTYRIVFEPQFDERDADGYPVVHVETAYRFPRSETTGHVILPADWDDPEDAIYDRYADE